MPPSKLEESYPDDIRVTCSAVSHAETDLNQVERKAELLKLVFEEFDFESAI